MWGHERVQMERRNQTNTCTAFHAEGQARAEALVSKDRARVGTAQKQSLLQEWARGRLSALPQT